MSVQNFNASFLEQVQQNVKTLTFSWYDYILFSTMLVLSAFIGIYFGCFGNKQSTAKEYLMGGKKMAVFPIAMSLTASHISGITLLAVPADIYRYGAGYALMAVALIPVILVTMYVFLPVFFKLEITSTYEYLGRRFDEKTRMLASFLFALAMLLYLPIVIYIPALAFSAATGVNIHFITPVVCGVCIFYTTLGGLKAVVWTDTLQFTVTLGALATVFFLGLRSAGGVGAVLAKAAAGGRLESLLDFDLDPTKRDSFFPVSIGIFCGWVSICSINQGCVQKFLSVPSLKDAQLTVIYFGIGMAVVTLTSVFTGLIIFSKYSDCDPFIIGTVRKSDQLLPYYVLDVAGDIPGLSGLFIAGVFCAGLSTLSAHLNCLAGTLYEDFISKWLKNPSEATTNHILRALVVITGVICTASVFIIDQFSGILPLAFSLGGLTGGPLLALFTLGVLFPKANSKGAFYGSIVGLIFSTWFVFTIQTYKFQGIITDPPRPTSIDGCYIDNITNSSLESTTISYFSTPLNISSNFSSTTMKMEEPKYTPFILFRISFYYHIVIEFFVSIIASLIISYLTNRNDPPVHRDLLSPVIHFLLPEDENCNEDNSIRYYDVDKALHIVTLNSAEKDLKI